MSMSIIKKFADKSGIKYIYGGIRRWKDNTFCDRFECGIGDILLLRDVPSNNQLLLTSRLLDVEDYLSGKDRSFPWQNTISRAAYGANHRETDGNRSFERLIESYLKDGYHSDSFITCDEEMHLMDGNHRMALHIHEKIESVNVRRVHRRVPFEYGGDWYFDVGISGEFLEQIYMRFGEIQEWLVDTGNTFCCCLSGPTSEVESLARDMCHLCRVLKNSKIKNGVFIQFAMMTPSYICDKEQLISKRAQKIERILKKRASNDVKIRVSRNCLEGKQMFTQIIH